MVAPPVHRVRSFNGRNHVFVSQGRWAGIFVAADLSVGMRRAGAVRYRAAAPVIPPKLEEM